MIVPMAGETLMSSSSSTAETLHEVEVVLKLPTTESQPKAKKMKQKKTKQPLQNGSKVPRSKNDRPLYQTLGEQLLTSTRPLTAFKALPPLPIESIPIPPIPTTSILDKNGPYVSTYEGSPRSRSRISLASKRSESSTLTGSTKVSTDRSRPTTSHKATGGIYTLSDFNAMTQTESLIIRYGCVAHMGVRDPSYSFWMNQTRTAVIHFKVLNKVAILGGDPLCHPDRLALSMQEFTAYCKKVGWKTAIIGASERMASIAQSCSSTTMHFGTETVLNPQTNEVLLGKSGKRITTQCKQLLDSSRGGITVHTYNPSLGRDMNIESELSMLYDEWRNSRNTTRDSQAFITVFDLFSMTNLMTFLYTRDKMGSVNGFAALRRLGADDGYHIDPFIQSSDAPRGVSDLLIYSSLAFLNVQGCTYLSLGFEPLTTVGEIKGMPSALHTYTRKIYQHVFGNIPVGGKEAFHARWKPDIQQEKPLYLVMTGKKIPSPRFMVAMSHFANVSLRQIVVNDLARLTKNERSGNKSTGDLLAATAIATDGVAVEKESTTSSGSEESGLEKL